MGNTTTKEIKRAIHSATEHDSSDLAFLMESKRNAINPLDHDHLINYAINLDKPPCVIACLLKRPLNLYYYAHYLNPRPNAPFFEFIPSKAFTIVSAHVHAGLKHDTFAFPMPRNLYRAQHPQDLNSSCVLTHAEAKSFTACLVLYAPCVGDFKSFFNVFLNIVVYHKNMDGLEWLLSQPSSHQIPLDEIVGKLKHWEDGLDKVLEALPVPVVSSLDPPPYLPKGHPDSTISYPSVSGSSKTTVQGKVTADHVRQRLYEQEAKLKLKEKALLDHQVKILATLIDADLLIGKVSGEVVGRFDDKAIRQVIESLEKRGFVNVKISNKNSPNFIWLSSTQPIREGVTWSVEV